MSERNIDLTCVILMGGDDGSKNNSRNAIGYYGAIRLPTEILQGNIRMECNVLFHANSMAVKYLTIVNVLCRKCEL